MFGFIEKVFFTGSIILSNVNSLTVTLLRCNEECNVRPEIVNVNSDESVFYAFSIKTRSGGSCNNINDP